MSRRQSQFTQSDVTRLIKAALAAGIGVERISGVQLTRDGALLLFCERKQRQPETTNPWDDVLEE